MYYDILVLTRWYLTPFNCQLNISNATFYQGLNARAKQLTKT